MIVGSFLNVLIYRLPLEKSIVSPRSSCPNCGKLIFWYENVPVISYIFLKGKCSDCNKHISLRYPLVEIFSGLAACYLFPKYIGGDEIILFVCYFSIYAIFITHFLIDIDHQILPNSLNFVLFLLFVFLSIKFDRDLLKFMSAGLVIGGGGPLLVVWIFYLIRGQIGLGGGDIKLFAVLGIYLGPYVILQNIFVSCFLGSIVGVTLIILKKMDKNNPIAFGPFIIITASVQIFFPKILSFLDTLFIF